MDLSMSNPARAQCNPSLCNPRWVFVHQFRREPAAASIVILVSLQDRVKRIIRRAMKRDEPP
jgi:hypothetical protein